MEMRDRIWEETDKLKELFVIAWKPNTVEASESMTHMKGIKMKPPNNGKDRAPNRQLLSPNEASNSRNGLHLIELFTKGVP